MQSTSCKMSDCMIHKQESRLPGININNLKYAHDITPVAETGEALKSFRMSMKEENEKAGSKLNIQKTKIMASGSHHFMANRRGKSGSSDRFYFLGLQNHCMVTAAIKLKNACSLEEKL